MNDGHAHNDRRMTGKGKGKDKSRVGCGACQFSVLFMLRNETVCMGTLAGP